MSFSLLIETAVRSILLLSAAALLAAIGRKGSAALRHRIWALSFLALGLLPLLALHLPEWRMERPAFSAPQPRSATATHFRPSKVVIPVKSQSIAVAPQASKPSSPWPGLFVGLWMVGVTGSIASTVLGLFRITRLGRRGIDLPVDPSMGIPPHTRIVLTSVEVPMTLGALRPIILLPETFESWNEERRRMVLLHEGAHVRRGDWAWLLLARLVMAFYWLNPLAWVAAAQMRAEAERAADDVVLAAGVPADRYAETLVDLAANLRGRPAVAAISFIEKGTLKARVAAILENSRRTVLGRRASLGAFLLGIVVVLPCAAARLVPSPIAFREGMLDLGKDGRIEVVAITSLDGGKLVSWDVHGAVLPQPYAINPTILDWFRRTAPAVPTGQVARYIVLRASLAGDAVVPSFSDRFGGEILPSLNDNGPLSEPRFEIRDIDDASFRVLRLTVPKTQASASLFARVATGSWIRDGQIDFRDGETNGSRGQWFDPRLAPALSNKPWKAELSYVFPESFRDRLTRVVQFPGKGITLREAAVGQQYEYLDEPAESLRRIEIFSRPLTSVMLDGLPMSPRAGGEFRSHSSLPDGTIVAQNGKAHLPDGSDLILEGIWDADRPNSTGWTLSGKPKARSPLDFWANGDRAVHAPGFRARRFSLSRTRNAESVQNFAYDGDGLLAPLQNPSELFDSTGAHIALGALVGSERSSMGLLLKLATSPYRTVAEGTFGSAKGYRTFFRKGMAGNSTFSVEFPAELLTQMEGVDATLEPLDAKGEKVRKADGGISSSRTTSDGGENVIEFDLPPDRARRVKRLALRVRPFTWVSFPEVPLNPR